jgi:3-hydroxyisobutyrate dehydrogenase
MTKQPTVAVLGTGIMGLPMAANLAKAGLAVRAWNRTSAKAQPLTEHGATVHADVAEAVRGAGIVVTILADGPAARSAFEAFSGALEPGALWIQMSTVGVEWADKLAAAAEESGTAFVDAPVMGSRAPAEAGTLVVLAAGPDDVHERCAPVFDAVGSRTVWVGAAGAASRLKLVVNSWTLSMTNAAAESIGLARALGIDPMAFLNVMAGGAANIPYLQLKGRAMVDGEFPASFPAHLALKDAELVLAAGGDEVDLSGARATRDHLAEAVEGGYGDEDMAALYRAVVRECSQSY